MVLEIITTPYLRHDLTHFHKPKKLIYLDLQNSPYAQKQHRRLGTELKQKQNAKKNGGKINRITVTPAPSASVCQATSRKKDESKANDDEKRQTKKEARREQKMVRRMQQFRAMSAHQSPDGTSVARDTFSVDTSKTRHGIEVIRMCIKHFGWKELGHSLVFVTAIEYKLQLIKFAEGRRDQKCDLYWRTQHLSEAEDMKSGVVNKFPGMGELVSKTNLLRLLNQMKSFFPEEYTFYPRSWSLPGDYKAFKTHVKAILESKSGKKPTFIVKPRYGAQGEGIYLLRDPSDYKAMHRQFHVVQEYLGDVFLINQYKFDLRIYCLLKSLDPLEIYVCREGMARFSTVPYENPTDNNINTTFMHLTNYSLNKRSETFVASDDEDKGSKRTLSSVFKVIESKGYDIGKLWTDIEKIICKTVIAILPDLKVQYNSVLPPNKPGPSCFHILGFDILLLRNLKPSLLEVNNSPSLSTTHEVEISKGCYEFFPCKTDILIKLPLVRDTLEVVLSLKSDRRKPSYSNEQNKETKNQEKESRTSSSDSDSDDEVLNVVPHAPSTERPTTTRSRLRFPNLGFLKKNKEKTEIDIKDKDSDKENKSASQPNSVQNSPVKRRAGAESSNSHSAHSSPSKSKPLNPLSDSEDSDDDDDDDEDDDDDDDEDDSKDSDKNEFLELFDKEQTLKMVYPGCFEEKYERMRILERLVVLFQNFIRVRRGRRLCHLGFKDFVKKCLPNKNIADRMVDILYIDGIRLQESASGFSGLTFEGFLNCCVFLAKRRFNGRTKLEILKDLIEYCEDRLEEASDDSTLPQITENRSGRQDGRSGHLSMTEHASKITPMRRSKTIATTRTLSDHHKPS